MGMHRSFSGFQKNVNCRLKESSEEPIWGIVMGEGKDRLRFFWIKPRMIRNSRR